MAWSWGAGTQGQLGLGALQDAMLPQAVESFSPSDLACGGAHAAAILDGGNVVAWGRGQGDQEELVAVPSSIPFTSRICQVSAGWNHTAFVSENGELFTCGDGQFGQLGLGDFSSRRVPSRVMDLLGVLKAACGMRHTLVLTESSQGCQVKSFGLSKRGQVGTRFSKELKRLCFPQHISSLDSASICTVAASGDHSAALSGSKKLYLWGKGYDDSPDALEPYIANEGLEFSEISLGWNHGLGLTEKGEVFSWGSNRYGQLGTSHQYPGPKQSKIFMHKVDSFLNSKVVCVSAGAEHSAAVLASGELFTWGWGEHGQLGLGHCYDQMLPQQVEFANHKIGRVYCGSGFTFATQQSK